MVNKFTNLHFPELELFLSFLAGGGGVAGTPLAADRVRRLPSTSGPKP